MVSPTPLLRVAALSLLCLAGPLCAAVENDTLPHGSVFQSWELRAHYARTYHVAQTARYASDNNPGTAARPWRSICKAASALRPGERVAVHRGVHREWMVPARGGEVPDAVVACEAAQRLYEKSPVPV